MFNDRGDVRLYAKVTDRVMPGILRGYQGLWYEPDEQGVDNGGCLNVLIDDMLTSPGGASNFNTCLVEVRKEEA
jgi:anaerobic dimethyl sulfoxide reductase subunit A